MIPKLNEKLCQEASRFNHNQRGSCLILPQERGQPLEQIIFQIMSNHQRKPLHPVCLLRQYFTHAFLHRFASHSIVKLTK
jgi:hypothetical protein